MTTLYRYHLTIHHPNRKLSVCDHDFEAICLYYMFERHVYIVQVTPEIGKFGGKHFHCIARSAHKLSFRENSKFGHYRLFWKEIKSDQYLKNLEQYHKKDTRGSLKEQFSSSMERDQLYMSPEDSDYSSGGEEGEEEY